MVNLEMLEDCYFDKVSSFFDSVANYKKHRVGVSTPTNLSYHDFGTIECYQNNLKKVNENKDDFLNRWGAVLQPNSSKPFAENDLCSVSIIGEELSYQIKR